MWRVKIAIVRLAWWLKLLAVRSWVSVTLVGLVVLGVLVAGGYTLLCVVLPRARS